MLDSQLVRPMPAFTRDSIAPIKDPACTVIVCISKPTKSASAIVTLSFSVDNNPARVLLRASIAPVYFWKIPSTPTKAAFIDSLLFLSITLTCCWPYWSVYINAVLPASAIDTPKLSAFFFVISTAFTPYSFSLSNSPV